MWSRLYSASPWLIGIGIAVALVIALMSTAHGPASADTPMKICTGQTYALCAAARCNVYDGVAYCQCDVKSGNSISERFNMGKGQDVCSVNAAGPKNNYMVSTYSLDPQLLAPHGNMAVYHCGGGPSEGAYAQCDGGLCFTSTEGTTFPGFDKPVPKGQIICSCPITTSGQGSRIIGHEIMGPYPCQQSFFKYCSKDTSNTNTGSTMYVGAPPGTAQLLAARLGNSKLTFNVCR